MKVNSYLFCLMHYQHVYSFLIVTFFLCASYVSSDHQVRKTQSEQTPTTVDQSRPSSIVKVSRISDKSGNIVVSVTLTDTKNSKSPDGSPEKLLKDNATLASLIKDISTIIGNNGNAEPTGQPELNSGSNSNSNSNSNQYPNQELSQDSNQQDQNGERNNQKRNKTVTLPTSPHRRHRNMTSKLSGRNFDLFSPDDCVCVPYFQCNDTNQFITDGAGLINARSSTDVLDDETSNSGQQDRRTKSSSSEEQPTPASSAQPESRPRRGTNDGHCGKHEVCCYDAELTRLISETDSIDHAESDQPKCGRRNTLGISRILDSGTAGGLQQGDHPWMVALIKKDENEHSFVCGASLIGRQYVLTVAHCVESFANDLVKAETLDTDQDSSYSGASNDAKPRRKLLARMAEFDTQDTKELIPHEDFEVSEIIIHPEYRAKSLWNDIAILRLNRPVRLRLGINTICLPTRSFANVSDGRSCVATGWGKDAFKSDQHSHVLKQVELQIVPRPVCHEALKKTRLGPRFRLHSTFLCGGGSNSSDTCVGDGGGPLVCPPLGGQDDERQELAGLVSWGISCGLPDVPGVYVDVGQYVEWIENIVQAYPEADRGNDGTLTVEQSEIQTTSRSVSKGETRMKTEASSQAGRVKKER